MGKVLFLKSNINSFSSYIAKKLDFSIASINNKRYTQKHNQDSECNNRGGNGFFKIVENYMGC